MRGDLPEDYYALLGVDPDVDAQQLRSVWRRLALEWHPDRAGPSATSTFQKLSIAYAVLSDPVAREAYDRERRTERRPPPREPDPGAILWRQSGSLKTLLARGSVALAGDDVIELFLNRQEAGEGGMVSISLRVPVRCLLCGGKKSSCPRCGGKGVLYQLFSARAVVPADVPDGAILTPEPLQGMIRPIRFRVRIASAE